MLTNLRGIVDSLNAHGMIAILDYHQPMMKRNNLYTADNKERWAAHWGQVASYFSSTHDSTQLVYELLNEPEYSESDPNSKMTESDWYTLQQIAIDSIRAHDTEKSIMISGWHWSHPQGLRVMTVPTDPYNRLLPQRRGG